MKNLLFLVSHFYSGSHNLVYILNNNPRVQVYETNICYNHPDMLNNLFELGHKLDTTAAIYGDHVLHNHNFCSKSFYNFSKFIYVIRPPKPTLNLIAHNIKELTPDGSFKYYCLRLRRIYEMARKSGGLVVTHDGLSKSLNFIEDYLNLKNKLTYKELKEPVISDIDPVLLKEADDCYERYLYKIKTETRSLVI